ncbi:CopD family protein [Marivirga arenosa]|uniref:Protoporphyrinogen IX oxidase n=1 Tax=Marivirga arenosa TaxID=3059076 RepID=A0AA51N8F4_9BACT|nr:CopD family protein [Marivirga sp. ABR2-2]WMN08064.1 CopD family protein [Marivirga sp. ABR2-2]
MMYLYIKSLHIIFVVTWFAGLFYIVRLFIYQTEALQKKEPERSILHEQLSKMSRLLWFVITWPSAIITLILATSLLVLQPFWLQQPFMHIKLSFVFLLYLYHISCHYIYKKLQKGVVKFSSTQLRIWNEVATLFLVAVVFLIVLKNELNWIWGTIGFIGFGVLLMVAIKIYKALREKKN